MVNATWSAPTGAQGPSTYSVTATATKGHVFDDGKSTRVFTGSLPGALDASSATCAPKPPVPPTKPPVTTTPAKPVVSAKPAPLVLSTREVAVSCADTTATTKTTTTTTGWVLNAAGTRWVEAEPVVTVTSTTRRTAKGECPDLSDGGSTPVTPIVSSAGGGGGSGLGGAGGIGGGFGVGASAGAGVNSLAHAGADAASAISLAIALLAAGGIIVLRRRDLAGAAGSRAPMTE